jgi:hypothetical protein
MSQQCRASSLSGDRDADVDTRNRRRPSPRGIGTGGPSRAQSRLGRSCSTAGRAGRRRLRMGLASAPLARPLGKLALGPVRSGQRPLRSLVGRAALSLPILARDLPCVGLGLSIKTVGLSFLPATTIWNAPHAKARGPNPRRLSYNWELRVYEPKHTNLGTSLPIAVRTPHSIGALPGAVATHLRLGAQCGGTHPPFHWLQWPGTGCQPQPQPPHTRTTPLAGTRCFILDPDGAACPAIEPVKASSPATINPRARISPSPTLPSFHTEKTTVGRGPARKGTKNDTPGCVIFRNVGLSRDVHHRDVPRRDHNFQIGE